MKVLCSIVVLCVIGSCMTACPFAHGGSPTDAVKAALEKVLHVEVPAAHPDSRAVRGVADPLSEMNSMLKAAYHENSNVLAAVTLRGGSPLVILGSELTLARYNPTTDSIDTLSEPVTPRIFTDLKLVSHVGFASLVLAEGVVANGTVLSPSAQGDIMLYLDQFDAAYASLEYRDFTPEQMRRSVEILDLSRDFLEGIVSSGRVTAQDIQQFGDQVSVPTIPHITDAAIAQVNMAHGIMMKWKGLLGEREWDTMKVLITHGSHMARNMAWSVQYFARLLNTSMTSGERIIYAEALDMDHSLELVGVHELDFVAGEAYWHSGEHMHSDILAPATEQYLDVLFRGQ